jgi:hypothetical protein
MAKFEDQKFTKTNSPLGTTICVESRSGAVAQECSGSRSRSSNRTCGSPASGFRTAHRAGLPVLTRCSFALIPSPIPRWHRALLACRQAFGLHLKLTDSASTLPFSRLARCSFPLWFMCSLIRPGRTFCIVGFVCCRCRQPTLRLLPAEATVAGWVIFLPLDQHALSRRTSFSG